MKHCLLAIACCCLLPLRAAGACLGGVCPADAPPHPAVARVVNEHASGRYLGSGTLIANDGAGGVVLTCAHLFRDGVGRVTVVLPDGPPRGANLLAIDHAWDLAALAIAPPAAPPVEIAPVAPRVGDWLESCGYGPNGRFRCNRGRAQGYARAAGTHAAETLQLEGAARQGDSGGPVFNRQGQLVAVLWGTDGRSVGGTYCGRIRAFLAEHLRNRGAPNAPDAPRERENPFGDHLARIGERLDRIEAAGAVDEDKLHAIARQAAAELVAAGAQRAANAWAPALIAALGWTGPPAVAAVFALKLVAMMLGRRLRKKARRPRRPAATKVHHAPKPLNDRYARQLAEVYALSGRSATADATLGREYDTELRRAEQSSDAHMAAWARRIRDRVAKQFYRIHADEPAPVEPVADADVGQMV